MTPSHFMKDRITMESSNLSFMMPPAFVMMILEGKSLMINQLNSKHYHVFFNNILTNVPIQFYVAYRSMIITGCSKWTLYEHSHFNGQSACWHPRDNCAPAFFRDEKLMKGWAQKVSSVRRGCYSDKTFYGEPLLFERSADNSTIGSSGHVFGN